MLRPPLPPSGVTPRLIMRISGREVKPLDRTLDTSCSPIRVNSKITSIVRNSKALHRQWHKKCMLVENP